MAAPKRRRVGDGTRDYYRLRADAWQVQAIRLGIKPTARALSEVSGVPVTTLYRVIRGHAPNPETTIALLDTLQLPFEQLFEPVRVNNK